MKFRLLLILVISVWAAKSFSQQNNQQDIIISDAVTKPVVRMNLEEMSSAQRLPFSYLFNDFDERQLVMQFLENGIMTISNIPLTNNEIHFADVYKVHFSDNKHCIIVDSIIMTNRPDDSSCGLIEPFDNEKHENMPHNSIFPILVPGTLLRIDRAFQRIAIGNFTFNINLRTHEDEVDVIMYEWLKNKEIGRNPQINQRLKWLCDTSMNTLAQEDRLPFEYYFDDRIERHINISFPNRNEMLIQNDVAAVFGLNFTDRYAIEVVGKLIFVKELLSTTRQEPNENKVAPPFDDTSEEYTSCNSVFPILPPGTVVRCDKNFQYIRINDFYFRVLAYTYEDFRNCNKELKYLLGW